MYSVPAFLALTALILIGLNAWSYRKGGWKWHEPVISLAILFVVWAILWPVFVGEQTRIEHGRASHGRVDFDHSRSSSP